MQSEVELLSKFSGDSDDACLCAVAFTSGGYQWCTVRAQYRLFLMQTLHLQMDAGLLLGDKYLVTYATFR